MVVGESIGPYTITEKIGEGGMGQVYRARDTKLDRDVAIKVLPEGFAKDADRLARFQREAKTLASLNHPNIAAIYGLEESGSDTDETGPRFTALVMELDEGQDLSEKIRSGTGMSLDEVVPIAKQIAAAGLVEGRPMVGLLRALVHQDVAKPGHRHQLHRQRL